MSSLPTRPLTAMVIEQDAVVLATYVAALQDAGFEVTNEVANAAEALQLLPFGRPSLVLASQELVGLSAVEALPAIEELENPPEVVIVTTDLALRDRALEVGAFAIIDKTDTDLLGEVLADARHLFETGERRTSDLDRRSGVDRRQEQDWTKVTRERRSGDDRRHEDRRDRDERRGEREDRRQDQDWRQVTSERRGQERRDD